MITRQQKRPDHSFFLFGPRGTGKTTWLKQVLPDALWFDLLRTQTLLADGVLTSGHGVYTGPTELKDGPLRVWPLMRFFKELASGSILG